MPPQPRLRSPPLPADAIAVCADGCDFSTLQAALESPTTPDGAVVYLGDAVHTEGGITVTREVVIRGLGSAQTVLQAHAEAGAASERVLTIVEGVSVTIRDLTIRHGNPSAEPGEGGGIRNEGTLFLQRVVIADNVADSGGGIWNEGVLTLEACVVSGNRAEGSGIRYSGCNTGGGIKNVNGTLTLIGSTIRDNVAAGNGGGLFVSCPSRMELVNSTVSGNQAGRNGGGLYLKGAADLVHATVSDNQAGNNGGGLYVEGSAERGVVRGLLNLTHSIIAGNEAGMERYGVDDCMLADYGHIGENVDNLVADGSCSPTYSGDPLLGPLGDNGGPTPTHILLPGSPAIDAVPVDRCVLTIDQRGQPRPGDSAAAAGCDLGAVEIQEEEAGAPP